MLTTETPKTVLLVGASRGLGYAMAVEFLKHGWNIVGTVRDKHAKTLLHELAGQYGDRVRIEELDICDAVQLNALQNQLTGAVFEMLFVNAGTTNKDPTQTIGDVSTEEFIEVMLTNSLAPMRVIESLENYVSASGLIGVMSSGQGSISNNETGQRELYRGSKAALNMFMRSFAARQSGNGRALAVMAPGWIRTALGGPEAPLTIEDAIPSLVSVLLEKQGKPGLEYLDYRGRTVPW
ncbi:Short-chain dehydrogenase/reductase SDR (plasmid) [Sodalis praecaptivus]|uniref:Short-chain dehydrogenase/reductase SDR n=1 Tax=Sodalis praecaptivus TaxID=1239307 RepID=W0I445_9GAMM|nr:SDR family NAD(P)-dependent oxidoreductase [Sodalis praecaptivus]AHF79240.1 Short-chain dehydrogenase/reductase SDR [Sodalis praecaptivus]